MKWLDKLDIILPLHTIVQTKWLCSVHGHIVNPSIDLEILNLLSLSAACFKIV